MQQIARAVPEEILYIKPIYFQLVADDSWGGHRRHVKCVDTSAVVDSRKALENCADLAPRILLRTQLVGREFE